METFPLCYFNFKHLKLGLPMIGFSLRLSRCYDIQLLIEIHRHIFNFPKCSKHILMSISLTLHSDFFFSSNPNGGGYVICITELLIFAKRSPSVKHMPNHLQP